MIIIGVHMKSFLAYLFKFILSAAILLFAEKYFMALLSMMGINVSNLSNFSQVLINFILYLLIAFMLFIIYREEIKSDLDRFKHKFSKNLVYSIMAFAILIVLVLIVDYLAKVIGKNLNVIYNPIVYYNPFNETLNLTNIINFMTIYILKPFIYVVTFVLGIGNLFNNKSAIILSGIAYGAFIGYGMSGSITYLIINLVVSFVIFTFLGYLYDKNDNIMFSLMPYIFYLVFAGLLVTKVLMRLP